MAKRASSSSSTSKSLPRKASAAGEATSTPVRRTVVPRKTAASAATPAVAPVPITHERIAERAYQIWQSGTGGSDVENWHRAEAELRREAGLA